MTLSELYVSRRKRLRLPFFAFLGLSLLFSGCQQTATVTQSGEAAPEAGSTTAYVTPRKSPNDRRDYRYLTLNNQLRVLLVSDPETDKSAAALSVYRGSFHEPDSRPGLAHFLEHMLFIGTGKYPEVDSFQQYITANGGSSNAYTALDHTNYFFDIKNSGLSEGLDRFGHFFIDPLLSEEYVEREKNAVHSEYQLQLRDAGIVSVISLSIRCSAKSMSSARRMRCIPNTRCKSRMTAGAATW